MILSFQGIPVYGGPQYPKDPVYIKHYKALKDHPQGTEEIPQGTSIDREIKALSKVKKTPTKGFS